MRTRRIKVDIKKHIDKRGITIYTRHHYLQFRIFFIWFTCAHMQWNMNEDKGQWRKDLRLWYHGLNMGQLNKTFS